MYLLVTTVKLPCFVIIHHIWVINKKMGQEYTSILKNSGYVMEKKNKYFLDIDRKFIYHNLQAKNTMIEKINAMI